MSQESGESNKEEQTDHRDLTKEEKDLLPFDFKRSLAVPADDGTTTYYAEWHRHDVCNFDLDLPWHFDHSSEWVSQDPLITPADWETYYPGFRHVNITNWHTLTGL